MKSPPNQPKVAVVIVNWNKKEYVLNLLKSLDHTDYRNYDVVVVDNASTDGSVTAINKQFPDIKLLVNEENLGGTGGFNTGMRYALSLEEYKYIWLLDNDVDVENNTLSELVKVVEEDDEIGIAGSMTLNTDYKEMVNNAGIKIDWNSGLLSALFGNVPVSEIKKGVHVVDSVPACSALCRSETLKETGLMDMRYFIWWDDIDLCLKIGATGRKVVSVTSSIVFHPSEKRRALMNYYSYRNSLLMFSKYAVFTKRLRIYHRMASTLSKLILFSYITGNRYLSTILYGSIRDFFLNRWGKLHDELLESSQNPVSSETVDIAFDEEILILPTASIERIFKSIELIKKNNPSANITLVIQRHRKNLFKSSAVDNFIVYDEKRGFSILENTKLFFSLFRKNYDMAIMPAEHEVSPFGYTAKKCCVYLEDENMLKLNGVRGDMWKVFAATVLGEIIALPLTAALLLKSVQYNREKNTTCSST